jgi:hypothetical protein
MSGGENDGDRGSSLLSNITSVRDVYGLLPNRPIEDKPVHLEERTPNEHPPVTVIDLSWSIIVRSLFTTVTVA